MYAWHISFIEKAERFFIVLLIWIARCFNPLKYELFGDLSLFCICYNVPKYIWSRTFCRIFNLWLWVNVEQRVNCERMDISSAVKKILKDAWRTSDKWLQLPLWQKFLRTPILASDAQLQAEKSHIPVGSNCWSSSTDQKCKQQWWLSRHHFHHLLFIVLHIWARVRVDLAEQ